jgi:hypothetical protein
MNTRASAMTWITSRVMLETRKSMNSQDGKIAPAIPISSMTMFQPQELSSHGQ